MKRVGAAQRAVAAPVSVDHPTDSEQRAAPCQGFAADAANPGHPVDAEHGRRAAAEWMSLPAPEKAHGVLCCLWQWRDAVTTTVAAPHFPRFGVALALCFVRLWWVRGQVPTVMVVLTAGVNQRWVVLAVH